MATVTYHHQPGIHATRGTVPLAGTSHIYRVSKVLWPEAVEATLAPLLIGRSLHVCAGLSQLGDVRLDIEPAMHPRVIADAAKLPFADNAFATVLCDPPYNGRMQWQHDLLSELSRVASERVIFQHWFLGCNIHGQWKKAQSKFVLTDLLAWAPKSYFGRAQLIQVYDRVNGVEFVKGDDDDDAVPL